MLSLASAIVFIILFLSWYHTQTDSNDVTQWFTNHYLSIFLSLHGGPCFLVSCLQHQCQPWLAFLKVNTRKASGYNRKRKHPNGLSVGIPFPQPQSGTEFDRGIHSPSHLQFLKVLPFQCIMHSTHRLTSVRG